MKIGDTVKISNRNPNHLGFGVSAYANYEGVVTDVWEDNSFCISNGGSYLVMSMNDVRKKPKKGYWLFINKDLVFHKRINKKPINIKKLYRWFIPKGLL